jgi:hypothetical protein
VTVLSASQAKLAKAATRSTSAECFALSIPVSDALASSLLLRMRGKMSRPELAVFRQELFAALDQALGVGGKV